MSEELFSPSSQTERFHLLKKFITTLPAEHYIAITCFLTKIERENSDKENSVGPILTATLFGSLIEFMEKREIKFDDAKQALDAPQSQILTELSKAELRFVEVAKKMDLLNVRVSSARRLNLPFKCKRSHVMLYSLIFGIAVATGFTTMSGLTAKHHLEACIEARTFELGVLEFSRHSGYVQAAHFFLEGLKPADCGK